MAEDLVIHVTDEEEFNVIIRTAGERLVVVDFYAEWCPPCKAIAPRISQLARSVTHVTFVKVDVDLLQGLARSKGISAMPTFHFYKNGALVAQFQGAVYEKLVSTISNLAGPSPEEQARIAAETSPYKFFPMQTYTTFKELDNLPKIQEKIITTNKTFAESADESLQSFAIELGDCVAFRSLIGTLKEENRWHATTFKDDEYDALKKLLRWPPKHRFPILDVLRLVINHPHAADHYAAACKNGTDDNLFDVVVCSLMDDTVMSEMPCCMMIWRFLANSFYHIKTRACALEVFDSIIDSSTASLFHANANVKIAVVTTLLNAAVALKEANDAERLTRLVPCFEQVLNKPEGYPPLGLLTAMLGLGTCAYRQAEITAALKQRSPLAAIQKLALTGNALPVSQELAAILQ